MKIKAGDNVYADFHRGLQFKYPWTSITWNVGETLEDFRKTESASYKFYFLKAGSYNSQLLRELVSED